MSVLKEGSAEALLVGAIQEVQAVGNVAEAERSDVRGPISRAAAGPGTPAPHSGPPTRMLHQFAVHGPELLEAIVVEAGPQLLVIAPLHVVDDSAAVLQGVRFLHRVHVHGFHGVAIRAMQQVFFRKMLEHEGRVGGLSRDVAAATCSNCESFSCMHNLPERLLRKDRRISNL